MTVEIEPDAVHGAASTLRSSVGPLDGLASSCDSMADFTQSDMSNGLAAFKVTWSTALEILADDVEYVADRADAITDEFVRTDGLLADLPDDPDAIPPS